MSADIPVILVAMGEHGGYFQEEPVRYLNEHTDIPLVLLIDNKDLDPSQRVALDGVEWHTVIKNTGSKHPAAFRQQAYEIVRDHSNMVPLGVVELDERFEKQWDIPVLKNWNTL